MIWVAYAKRGHELDVERAINAMGINAWVAKKVEMRRAPTGRRWRAETEPFLPNYVWIECSADDWHRLGSVKHLAATMLSISPAAAARYLAPFRERIDADYAERIAKAQQREHLEAYSPGDKIELESGPLAGMLLTYRRMVETDKPEFPMIVASLSLFGKEGEIMVDPINLKRVAVA